MNQRIRKLMTMFKALHPRDDVDRLYVSRRDGRRGFASIENNMDTSIQRLKDYIEKHVGRLITAIRNNTNDTRTSRMIITRKQKWGKRQLYGHFKWLTSDISHKKTWMWLRKRNLKRKTESRLITAQNNTIKTNHIKARIDKTQQNSRCRLCGERDEIINHIISEYSKFAQNEYKTRLDWVVKVIHRELCKKWYIHNLESVQENETHKFLCDFEIQTDQ